MVAALDVPPQGGKLKIWILVLAIVGGFVLLLLLVLLLWMVIELTSSSSDNEDIEKHLNFLHTFSSFQYNYKPV